MQERFFYLYKIGKYKKIIIGGFVVLVLSGTIFIQCNKFNPTEASEEIGWIK